MNIENSYMLIIISALYISGCDSGITTSSFNPGTSSVYNFSIGTDTQCSSSHSRVGSTANLTMWQHGVSGTVTVIDDCTIEFTNFSYDGGGPAVYIYSGFNGSYTGANANRISSRITGTAFSNNTLRFVLPGTVTLDDFDSLSVWCVDFNANFGEVRF